MNTDWFFGYGSLVNRATHRYGHAFLARLTGFRRIWRVPVGFYDMPVLSIAPDAGSQIDGLVAHLEGGDWSGLDARETGYARASVASAALLHDGPADAQVQTYAVDLRTSRAPGADDRLRLSYLDVVAEGFVLEFGRDGLARFVATTHDWAPVLNDRENPLYPRARPVAADIRAALDAHLAAIGVEVLS